TISLFVITLYLGTNNSWISILNNLGSALDFLGYDNISMRLEELIQETQIRTFGPRRFSLIIITLITCWFQPLLKGYFKDTYFVTYYNLMIIGFLLFNLLGNTHHIFIRPLTYLSIFSIPTTAFLIVYLHKSIRKYFPILFIILILTLSFLPLSIIVDNGKGNDDFTNYKFYWYHDNK